MPTIDQDYDPAVPLADLTPHPENANEGDVGAIAESMTANGFFGTVLAQKSTGAIITGEHRWRAARTLGEPTVPVLWADVDDDRAARIRLADNRTARLGRDDETALAALLTDLATTPGGLTGTGYDGDDLDQLIQDLNTDPPPLPDPPEPKAGGPPFVCPKCGWEAGT